MLVRIKRCLKLCGASSCENLNKHRLVGSPFIFTSLQREPREGLFNTGQYVYSMLYPNLKRITIVIPNRTFLVCFGSISGEVGQAMVRILERSSLAEAV